MKRATTLPYKTRVYTPLKLESINPRLINQTPSKSVGRTEKGKKKKNIDF